MFKIFGIAIAKSDILKTKDDSFKAHIFEYLRLRCVYIKKKVLKLIIVKNIQKMKDISTNQTSIGFVPTMGALHKGHISLIKNSISNNKTTIVSIFVNPAQFGENEDFHNYPNKLEEDIKICEKENVDILFLPNKNDMYFNDELIIQANPLNSFKLEGKKRIGHFDGVLIVVLKLFNIIKPDNAYFGKKDTQQVLLIEKMIKTLFLDINIIRCEIIREENGIAMSSRNIYLDKNSNKKLQLVSKSLFKVKDMVVGGERKSDILTTYIKKELADMDINYIAIIDKELNKCDYVIVSHSIIVVAVSLNNVSYLDNIWL